MQNDALLEFILDPLVANIGGIDGKETVSLIVTETGQILRCEGTDFATSVIRRILTSVSIL